MEGADSQSHKQGIFTLIGSRIFSVCQPIGELDFHFPYYGICVGATYMQYGLISRGPISMTKGRLFSKELFGRIEISKMYFRN